MIKISAGKLDFNKILITIIIGIVALTMILPMFWMLSTSFKFENDIFSVPIKWIPTKITFQNYYSALFD